MSNRTVRRVSYEWDYESFDEHNDIVDHNHFDKFPGIPSAEPQDQITGAVGTNLVLVRDVFEGLSGDDFNMSADLVDRSWAYVADGKLPATFDDGTPVPKRFFKHLPKGDPVHRGW